MIQDDKIKSEYNRGIKDVPRNILALLWENQWAE